MQIIKIIFSTALFLDVCILIGSCNAQSGLKASTESMPLSKLIAKSNDVYFIKVSSTSILSKPQSVMTSDGSRVMARKMLVIGSIIGSLRGQLSPSDLVAFEYLEWADEGGSFSERLELIRPGKQILVMLKNVSGRRTLMRDLFQSTISLNMIRGDDFLEMKGQVPEKVAHFLITNAVRMDKIDRLLKLKEDLRLICSVGDESKLMDILVTEMKRENIGIESQLPLLRALDCGSFL